MAGRTLTDSKKSTPDPRGPSPSGGSSAANPLSLVCPARIARSPGCRGTTPAAAEGPWGSGF